MQAVLSDYRGSPRRFNQHLQNIKGLNALQAVERLKFVASPYAQSLKKLVASAIANATYKDATLNPNNLIIAEGTVGRGSFLKRVCFRGRGRTGRITKASSNVRIVLRNVEVKNGK